MKPIIHKKALQATGAAIAWFAVTLQFVLMLNNRTAPVPETVIRFFSYFTILTNTLTAVAFTALTGYLGKQLKGFFEQAGAFTALTVYMLIVGLVYNIILRWQWEPAGLQKIVDEMLHVINPLFIFIYWLLFAKSSTTKWKDSFTWLLYPLLYCVYILVRGFFSKFYPYPFVDVNELGYSKVLLNCLYITAGFLLVSLLLIAAGKLFNRK
ncbi:MAG: Pr6Pr family membrane protein [Ferruginibacter sp.]